MYSAFVYLESSHRFRFNCLFHFYNDFGFIFKFLKAFSFIKITSYFGFIAHHYYHYFVTLWGLIIFYEILIFCINSRFIYFIISFFDLLYLFPLNFDCDDL